MNWCFQKIKLKLPGVIFLIFILNGNFNFVFATDSTTIIVRRPTTQHIEKFKNDNDFNYGTDIKEPKGFFARILKWIEDKLIAFLNKTNYNNFWKYIFIAVIITFLVLVVLKIFGKEISLIFKSNKSKIQLPYEVLNENIHEINLDELVSKAIENRNYRLAIRYLYLKALKSLSDKNIINWHPEKTNRIYLAEISNQSQRELFKGLTQSFEFAWYGDVPVSETIFMAEQNRFKEFNNSI